MKYLYRKEMVVIFFAAFSLIIGLILIRVIPPFPVISDFLDYDQIGQSLANTGSYITISEQQIIYPPLYPIFLALIYKIIGHSYLVVYLMQFILTGLIAGVSFLIAYQQLRLSKKVGLIVGVVVMLWPYLILYSLLLSSEVLFMFFLILFIYQLFYFIEKPTKQHAILAGLAIGLAVLARPVALLLPLWLIIGLTIINYLWPLGLNKKHLINGLLGLMVFIASLMPWTGYVYQHFGRIIPVASNLSYVFNKANTTLGYLENKPLETETKPTTKTLVKTKLTNIYLFWNPGASGYQADSLTTNFPQAKILLWFYRIGFLLIVVGGLGAIYWAKANRLILAGWAVILYFWALHTVLFPFPRYTLVIMPLVIALAVFNFYTTINYLLCRKKS